MNLGDYIGDTRTDSLPPGFLKSIKIKYRHEASHVFAGLPPCSQQSLKAAKPCDNAREESFTSKNGMKQGDEKSKGENEVQDVPSFMSWRVPSRLLNQKYEANPEAIKSASNLSRQSTRITTRSLTSITVKRSKKKNESQTDATLENKTEKKQNDFKESPSKTSSGKDSKSRRNENDRIPRDENSKHVLKLNPRILQPLKPKKVSASKEKSAVQNKTKPQKSFLEIFPENKVSHLDVKTKFSKPQDTKKHPQKTRGSDENFEKDLNKREVISKRNPESLGETRAATNNAPIARDDISQNACDKVEDEKDKGAVSAKLNSGESETLAVKLSHTPERIEKIYNWVKTSNKRECEAAFNLLSTYNKNEEIQIKTRKKKDRVRIALQALERRRLPDNNAPALESKKKNLAMIKLNCGALESRLATRDRQEIQTWHHVPVYNQMNASYNTSALFGQPSRSYQRHFSIHPEWGLHTHVKYLNSIAT